MASKKAPSKKAPAKKAPAKKAPAKPRNSDIPGPGQTNQNRSTGKSRDAGLEAQWNRATPKQRTEAFFRAMSGDMNFRSSLRGGGLNNRGK